MCYHHANAPLSLTKMVSEYFPRLTWLASAKPKDFYWCVDYPICCPIVKHFAELSANQQTGPSRFSIMMPSGPAMPPSCIWLSHITWNSLVASLLITSRTKQAAKLSIHLEQIV